MKKRLLSIYVCLLALSPSQGWREVNLSKAGASEVWTATWGYGDGPQGRRGHSLVAHGESHKTRLQALKLSLACLYFILG